MNFTQTQNTLLLLSLFFLVLSLYLFIKEKRDWKMLIFLGLSAASLFSFAASLDPFLNMWDERFHALVAKNLMLHPLKPTLYDDPVISMAYNKWDEAYIWLHKQPLFLWQIALSFKLFGISEFTLRIPNIVLSTTLVLATYRSGKLLFNRNTGYISGILMMSSFYLIELVSGRQGIDHNDVSFLAYVSFSIWAFIEYYYSQKKYWLYLIGAFSGMAILCKWLVGLLIYLGWMILRIQERKLRLSENKDFFIALVVTVLVALPWQLLTFSWYPTEAMAAQAYNSLHFTEVIEGHGGDFWYHFKNFDTLYGALATFCILLSLFLSYKSANSKKLVISIMTMLFATYLFYSMAATKMPSFTIVVAMLVFIFLAFLIDYFIQMVKPGLLQNIVFASTILILTTLRVDPTIIDTRHHNDYARHMIENRDVFKALNLPDNTVIFNVTGRHYVEAMFYTGLPAYHFMPTDWEYEELIAQNRRVAIFHTSDMPPLPEYLNHSDVIIINETIHAYE